MTKLEIAEKFFSLLIDSEVMNAIKDGTLEKSEMYPALCFANRQFKKAYQILEQVKKEEQ